MLKFFAIYLKYFTKRRKAQKLVPNQNNNKTIIKLFFFQCIQHINASALRLDIPFNHRFLWSWDNLKSFAMWNGLNSSRNHHQSIIKEATTSERSLVSLLINHPSTVRILALSKGRSEGRQIALWIPYKASNTILGIGCL